MPIVAESISNRAQIQQALEQVQTILREFGEKIAVCNALLMKELVRLEATNNGE